MSNNWRNKLKKNYPIDALDGDNTWYEALISNVINKNKKYLCRKIYGME